MKQSNLLITLIICFLQVSVSLAQQKFTIKGKIELVTKSKNLHVSNNIIPIKPDGTFEFSGEVSEPGKVFIRTDSSGIYLLWLDQGDYVLKCTEHQYRTGGTVMIKASIESGPLSATVFNEFEQHTYTGFQSLYPKTGKTGGKGLQQAVVKKYTESLFKKYPGLKSLPDILKSAYHFVGDSATKVYISMLPAEMQNDEAIQQIKKDINRQEKIAKEGVFEDFSMHTADGKDFKLSDIKNKKIILIDFWSSSCGPCRAEHPNFIKIYEKYADKGLEIVSISLDDNTDAWKDAIIKDNIGSWINVSDLKGWQSDPVKNYSLNFIPFRFMLDGNRKIIKVYSASMPTDAEILANLR